MHSRSGNAPASASKFRQRFMRRDKPQNPLAAQPENIGHRASAGGPCAPARADLDTRAGRGLVRPRLMRSVWITRTGPPEVLEVRDGPEPVPAAGQAVVRVRASGVNFADVMARLGFYPDAPPRPCVVGYEVAGTVEALGPGADGGLRPGSRVVALTRFGGYAEAVAVPTAQLFPLDDGMPFEE